MIRRLYAASAGFRCEREPIGRIMVDRGSRETHGSHNEWTIGIISFLRALMLNAWPPVLAQKVEPEAILIRIYDVE